MITLFELPNEAIDIMQSEPDRRFYIAPSNLPGAGNGLFAKFALGMGEELRVEGILVAADSVQDECTRYADAYKFRLGEHLLIPTGYAGMVNHSLQKANMEKVIVGNGVYLRTLRPIDADEELFFSYSRYAQERFHLTR